MSSAVLERQLRLERPLDLARTLWPLAHGTGDPTIRFHLETRVTLAHRTPEGAAALQLDKSGSFLKVRAWGPGAAGAADNVPGLVGEHDDPERLVANDRRIARLQQRFEGLRLPRSGRVFDALIPAILEQKVTGFEARRAYRSLIHRYSQLAPGPTGLWLPLAPDIVVGIPYFAFHRHGVERRRAEVIVRAAAEAPRLEGRSIPETYARLKRIPGIGPWTLAEVGRVALGDPDAVSVGDYHVPSLVSWVLAGERHADDARMLELLEPFRGQRGRVQRLLEASGDGPPRRGPRMSAHEFADR